MESERASMLSKGKNVIGADAGLDGGGGDGEVGAGLVGRGEEDGLGRGVNTRSAGKPGNADDAEVVSVPNAAAPVAAVAAAAAADDDGEGGDMGEKEGEAGGDGESLAKFGFGSSSDASEGEREGEREGESEPGSAIATSTRE